MKLRDKECYDSYHLKFQSGIDDAHIRIWWMHILFRGKLFAFVHWMVSLNWPAAGVHVSFILHKYVCMHRIHGGNGAGSKRNDY